MGDTNSKMAAASPVRTWRSAPFSLVREALTPFLVAILLAIGPVADAQDANRVSAAPTPPISKVTTQMLWQQLPSAQTVMAKQADRASVSESDGPMKLAFFVNNRTRDKLNDFVLGFEDKLIAEISGGKFTPISVDDAVQALNQFAPQSGGLTDRNALGTLADRVLADQTSALRLAQNMGADCLLVVGVTTFTAAPRKLSSAGIRGTLLNYTIGLSYRICEGVTGSSLDGASFMVRKATRHRDAAPDVDPAIVEEMMNEAAQKVSEKLAANADRIKRQPKPGMVEILISPAPRDLQGNEVSLLDLSITEDNMIVKGDASIPVQVAATIEIDGMAVGTSPARLRVAPGMHKLRLSRAGFDDLNLTINATEGLTLTPAMTMSKEGFARWKEIRDFLLQLDVKKALTDARCEVMRGYAQMLRQSGYKIDIKIDSKEAPTFIEKKSIYSVE